MTERTLKTGELAARAGVNRETIRYYERNGLLAKPKRTAASYRPFNFGDLERIIFIKNAQRIGFTLAEIRELLALADGKITRRTEVREIARSRLDTIEAQISGLQRLRSVLRDLMERCEAAKGICTCPILECLGDSTVKPRETTDHEP